MKKLSYLMIGLIAGIVIGTSTSAFAAIGDKVEATFAKFTFVVNGTEKPLDADPLVYQGSTYLPVRTVANLLGYDVTYKADSKTIELTQPQAVGQSPSNTTGGGDVSVISDSKVYESGQPAQTKEQRINYLKSQIKNLTGRIDTEDLNIKSAEEDQKLTPEVSQQARIDRSNAAIKKLETDLEACQKELSELEVQPTPTP